MSHRQAVKNVPVVLPLRHEAVEQTSEASIVRGLKQVNHLVHDDVLEALLGLLGELVYLWCAVDQSGEVLDVLVQKRRDAKAAKRLFRKLLKGLRDAPRIIVTDKLPSYASAMNDVMPSVAHHRGRRSNNRAENSHQPTRERERARDLRVNTQGSMRYGTTVGAHAPSLADPFRNLTKPAAGHQLRRSANTNSGAGAA